MVSHFDPTDESRAKWDNNQPKRRDEHGNLLPKAECKLDCGIGLLSLVYVPARAGRAVGAGGAWLAGKVFGSQAGNAPRALRPLATNPISPQKQAGHVPGTPQHAERVKRGKPTSTFFRADQAEELTRRAWSNGLPVPGRPNLRDFEFGFPVGRGPRGGLQTRVRVHIDILGRIHGHPVGRELTP